MWTRARPFRFGIQLRPQRTTWDRYRKAVQLVEELGFDTVWNSDRLLPAWADDGARFETLTTLGAMADATTTVRLGALTFGNLYRDPVTLAKSATMVDHISGGRLELAIGAAWGEREFRAYGLPYPDLSERYARLDESLQIVKSLWAQPRTSFVGQYYRVDNAPCAPKPLQSPHPPIIVGGVGAKALHIAAKHATGSNMYGAPERVAERATILRKMCQDVGRDFDEIELSLHTDSRSIVEPRGRGRNILTDCRSVRRRYRGSTRPVADRDAQRSGCSAAPVRRYRDITLHHALRRPI